jgi:hypothetical protein
MTKRRRTDDDDEEGKPWGLRVLRDGERMRVPMTMIDSTGRSVLDSHAPRVNDSAAVHHQPGFHFTADQAAMDERDRAYREVDPFGRQNSPGRVERKKPPYHRGLSIVPGAWG